VILPNQTQQQKLISIQLELEFPLSQWRDDPTQCCQLALLKHGEPLRWAITAAEVRVDLQWLKLEAVLLV
jgi:hypothetical protein